MSMAPTLLRTIADLANCRVFSRDALGLRSSFLNEIVSNAKDTSMRASGGFVKKTLSNPICREGLIVPQGLGSTTLEGASRFASFLKSE